MIQVALLKGICVSESGPVAVTVNAAPLASFELTVVNFPFSSLRIYYMIIVEDLWKSHKLL